MVGGMFVCCDYSVDSVVPDVEVDPRRQRTSQITKRMGVLGDGWRRCGWW